MQTNARSMQCNQKQPANKSQPGRSHPTQVSHCFSQRGWLPAKPPAVVPQVPHPHKAWRSKRTNCNESTCEKYG